MVCRALVVVLLERIEGEMKHPEDREVVRKYLEKVKKSAWSEVAKELL